MTGLVPGGDSEQADPIEQGLWREIQRAAGHLAAELRQSADNIERHISYVHRDLRDLKPDYVGVAQEVADDVRRCVTNLQIGRVIRAAADADRYVRQPPAAGSPAPRGGET